MTVLPAGTLVRTGTDRPIPGVKRPGYPSASAA